MLTPDSAFLLLALHVFLVLPALVLGVVGAYAMMHMIGTIVRRPRS